MSNLKLNFLSLVFLSIISQAYAVIDNDMSSKKQINQDKYISPYTRINDEEMIVNRPFIKMFGLQHKKFQLIAKQIKMIQFDSTIAPDLGDIDVQYAISHCVNLEHCSFAGAKNITNLALKSLFCLPRLKTLILTGCSQLTDEAIYELKTGIPTLQAITLKDGSYQKTQEMAPPVSSSLVPEEETFPGVTLDNDGMCSLLVSPSELENFELWSYLQKHKQKIRCFTFSNALESSVNSKHLQYLVQACPCLDTLYLGESFCTTEESLRLIAKNLSSLKELYIKNGKAITKTGLMYLADLKNLSHLECTACSLLDIDDFADLVRELPQTKALFEDANGNHINNEEALTYKQGNLQLEELSFFKTVNEDGVVVHVLTQHPTKLNANELETWKTETKRIRKIITDEGFSDPDLYLLAKYCPNLELLHFHRGRITDSGLECLASFKNLKHLKFEGCVEFTNQGLGTLARGLINLTHLSINACPQVFDPGVVAFKECKSLCHLDLRGCKQLTDTALAALSSLTQLHYLNLAECPKITDLGLVSISNFPVIKELNLTEIGPISPSGLKPLSNLAYLESLHLGTEKFTGTGLQYLKDLKNLTHLHLAYCNHITEEGLMEIALLKELVYLALKNCGIAIGAKLGEHLSKLPKVVSATFTECYASTPFFETSKNPERKLSLKDQLNGIGNSQVTQLDLSESRLSEEVFESLREAPLLKSLNLSHCYLLTKSKLANLHNLKQLTDLNLTYCNTISDEELKGLRNALPALKTLYCERKSSAVFPRFRTLSDIDAAIADDNEKLKIKAHMSASAEDATISSRTPINLRRYFSPTKSRPGNSRRPTSPIKNFNLRSSSDHAKPLNETPPTTRRGSGSGLMRPRRVAQ